MMERLRRFILWAIMLVLTFTIFIRSHGTMHESGPMASFCDQPVGVMVRIAGNVALPGIYVLPEKANVKTVIKMAVRPEEQNRVNSTFMDTELKNGDVVELLRGFNQGIDITVKTMRARERVILGIPLDINRMDVDDWESLPGVGPVLAFRIVNNRQINGEFSSVSDLKRVPGIGENKFKRLNSLF
jgi:competence protein ComEA